MTARECASTSAGLLPHLAGKAATEQKRAALSNPAHRPRPVRGADLISRCLQKRAGPSVLFPRVTLLNPFRHMPYDRASGIGRSRKNPRDCLGRMRPSVKLLFTNGKESVITASAIR